MTLTFDPATLPYAARIQSGASKLSALRITLVGKSGALYLFNTYTYAPVFEPAPRHLFSPCGRVTVMRRVVEINGEKHYAPNQYAVYYNGVAVPEDRYTIRHEIKARKARVASRYKHTLGRDDSVTAAMRNTAMQQA